MPDTPVKMVIQAFKDPQLKQLVEEYPILVNPSNYQQNFKIEYNKDEALGRAGTPVKFSFMPPATMSFDLTLDATGAIPNSPIDLASEIQKLIDTVYTYNGEIHSPNYLTILWGKLSFPCRLTSMDISYSLFRQDGSPLRAKVSLAFDKFQSEEKITKIEDNKSPDITRRVTVKAGDTLPTMTFLAYGDDKYYIQVAQHNKLDHFRQLTPGQAIEFPPLVSESESL